MTDSDSAITTSTLRLADPGADLNSARKRFALLAIGAIGVVFGDIGTSPLYAFREALAQAGDSGTTATEIIGVLSLALWALILVVTVKYVLFLMRADNSGEGGVLALMALAQRGAERRSAIIVGLGAVGAALFYGDAAITPALSVLSAVEGLKTVPDIGPAITGNLILGISTAILIALFAVQSRGTNQVARLFGPVCVLWFLSIGALGLLHIADAPAILAAFNPEHAVSFLASEGKVGLFVLGAVFLTVTGAEALTADMGHFGRAPIQAGWLLLVFPALSLNYLGQGAFALSVLEQASAAGQSFQNQDWFFLMAPETWRVPLVLLATAATIIASQAVITGAFSLTQQAMQLGLLPRLRILQTSAVHAGQIYLPVINVLLFAGVMILVFGFRTSSSMAAAYGIAVTGTMVVTTCLAFVVVRRKWGWRLPMALALIAPLLAIDLIFFGANILRVADGGWVPLVIAASIALVVFTWIKGRRLVAERQRDDSIPLIDLAASLAKRPPQRVPGVAVFLSADPEAAPAALMHNLKHNRVLHERNLIVSVRSANRPFVPAADRLSIRPLDTNFTYVTVNCGFMEQPNIPQDLGVGVAGAPLGLVPFTTSYFIGRSAVKPAALSRMPFWQDLLFIFLQRNANNPTDAFGIPPNRVVELGSQVEI